MVLVIDPVYMLGEHLATFPAQPFTCVPHYLGLSISLQHLFCFEYRALCSQTGLELFILPLLLCSTEITGMLS